MPETPDFDEWVEYCLTQGYADFSSDADDAVMDRTNRFLEIPPTVLNEHLIRLFREPKPALEISHKQLADSIWFLFGCASGYMGALVESSLPPASLHDLYRAVGDLYIGLFDKVCCRGGSEPRGDFTDSDRLDGAVYMIWDMGGIELGPMFNGGLSDVAFDLLEQILRDCKTSTCHMSALHALGHLQVYHPDRAPRVIDRYLAESDRPGHIAEYARRAREGMVQ